MKMCETRSQLPIPFLQEHIQIGEVFRSLFVLFCLPRPHRFNLFRIPLQCSSPKSAVDCLQHSKMSKQDNSNTSFSNQNLRMQLGDHTTLLKKWLAKFAQHFTSFFQLVVDFCSELSLPLYRRSLVLPVLVQLLELINNRGQSLLSAKARSSIGYQGLELKL